MSAPSRAAIILILVAAACRPCTVRAGDLPAYEVGAVAVRRDGRWELERVQPGTEDAQIATLTVAGTEAVRLHVLRVDQGVVCLPWIAKDHRPRTPTDLYWPDQWGAQAIGVTRSEGSPADVIVAVVDTGWYSDHAEQPYQVPGWDAVGKDDDPYPAYWHGTHVASIALARHDSVGIAGVAPRARLMPVRVCGGMFCMESDIAEGIAFAVAHGARVINLSLGGSDEMPYLHQAIDDAMAAGVIVVASRGNGGSTAPFYPASWTGVIAVSALDRDLALASFSSYSGVDFCAPGVDVIAGAGPGDVYRYASGTSMATPHVSAVVALALIAHPEWDRAAVVGAMAESATDLGAPGYDEQFGFGMVNAGAFLPEGE